MIEAKTGRKVQHVKIAELGERLQEFRGDTKSADHDMGIQSACRLFRDFMATRHPSAVHLYETTPGDADAFYKALRATKAPRTAHGYTATLKAAFARFMPPGAANPFAEVKLSGAGDSVHRRPFTAVQFRAMIDAAAGDPMMRDLITAGACTGMRRGDLCKLAWESIDLTGGMVIAKASKTGEPVEVPLFEPLREVLAARAGNGSEFCFPEAAAMLADNPHGLSYRFKRIVAAALDAAPNPTVDTDDTTDAAEMEGEGLAAIIANVAAGPRRERMATAFRRYCAGATFRQIETETGTPRGVISADFRAVEGWTGKRFVRRRAGRT